MKQNLWIADDSSAKQTDRGAARALGILHDQRAVVPLSQAFESGSAGDEHLLGALAEALVRLEVYQPVLDGLNSGNDRVFFAALMAISQWGDSRAIPALRALNKKDQNLNRSIGEVIATIEERDGRKGN